MIDSRYGDKKMAPHQYLAEIMCERIAERDKTPLPYKFWNIPKWRKIYVFQAIKASTLLQSYEFAVIMAALRNKKTYNVYSFGAMYLLQDVLEIEKARINSQDRTAVLQIQETTQMPTPIPSTKKNAIKDLL